MLFGAGVVDASGKKDDAERLARSRPLQATDPTDDLLIQQQAFQKYQGSRESPWGGGISYSLEVDGESVLVSGSEVERLREMSWTLLEGRVVRGDGVSLARVLTGTDDVRFVNGDPLDYRPWNLVVDGRDTWSQTTGEDLRTVKDVGDTLSDRAPA